MDLMRQKNEKAGQNDFKSLGEEAGNKLFWNEKEAISYMEKIKVELK